MWATSDTLQKAYAGINLSAFKEPPGTFLVYQEMRKMFKESLLRSKKCTLYDYLFKKKGRISVLSYMHQFDERKKETHAM